MTSSSQKFQDHGGLHPSRGKLHVTVLASEWRSTKGGLSTISRELAIELAKFPEVKITYFVPQCSDEDKRTALSHHIEIVEATRLIGYDELEWLSFPPDDLQIDVIVGHGVKLFHQAQVIRKSHKCKWIQVVHTDPEELGMYKSYENPISTGEKKHKVEVELCEKADFVVGVGPKLCEAFRRYLRWCKKDKTIIDLTPGVFDEFANVEHASEERGRCSILVFGRGDAEDFQLKGFDVAGKAVAELSDAHLVFVGAPEGRHEDIAKRLLECGLPAHRLKVKSFLESREDLKRLFCEVDLVLMPSRTEGFGLTGLEALSAGLPVLVSKNSGFGEALCRVPFGSACVIDSEDSLVWAEAIKEVWKKDRETRLQEAELLRSSYKKKYSWAKQSEDLVKKMVNIVNQDCQSSSQGEEGLSVSSTTQAPQTMTGEQTAMSIIYDVQRMQYDPNNFQKKTGLSEDLQKIASDKGFSICDNPGSGDCMFYALSEQLQSVKGIQISETELRKKLVEWLENSPKLTNGTDLFNFVHGYPSWADYLRSMEKDGTWGDHLILLAAANCYKTPIRVISSLDRDITINPDHLVGDKSSLVLGHIHEKHYVSLREVPVDAYENVLRTGEVKVYRARIMVIGQARAGKTSLIKSLLGLTFDPEEKSTVGIDPSSCRIDVDQAKDWQRTDQNLDVSQYADELASVAAKELVQKETEVELPDQDMPEENGSQTSQALMDGGETSHKDSTVSQSPDKMEEAPFENDHRSEWKSGNEAELPQLKIDPALPKEEFTRCLIKHLSGLSLHTDIKEPVVDLDLWDFAGQHLYYASHAVFLSQQAIYLLVYNLSIGLNDPAQPCVRQGAHEEYLETPNDQTNLDDLLSWLVSVSTVCPSKQGKGEGGGAPETKLPYVRPPVFIVGTHADKPIKNIKEMNLEIEKAVCSKHYARHVIPPYISIDNTRSSSDTGVDKLKEEIMKVLKQEPHMGKKIPVRWFNFEKAVKELVDVNVHYLDLQQLQIIVQEVCLITNQKDFDAMLDFYDGLGLIVRHGSTVVLRAQWLIDVFKQLITIPCYEEREPKYWECWEQLEEKGILQMELARHLLSKFTQQASVPESKSVTERDILGLMERFGLIAKFADEIYFVPAQLRSPSHEELLEKEPKSFDPCPLYIDFLSRFVPHGFFYQLVSRCICWCSKYCDPLPKLSRCEAMFLIGKPAWTHELILDCKKRFIRVVVRQIPDDTLVEAKEVPRLVRKFLEETLELPCFSNVEYKLRIACPLCPGKACHKHKEICTREDCLCLLDVVKPGGQLFCRKRRKPVTVSKLDEWFPKKIRPQVAKDKMTGPPVDAGAHQLGNEIDRNVCQGTLKVKEGIPTRDELEDLGKQIGENWEQLGRRLGIEDPELEGISQRYHRLSEKGYQMLKLWNQKEGSAATYQALNCQLRHKLVRRQDLAEKFCYIQVHSRKRKLKDESSGDQKTEECAKRLKSCSLGL